MFPSPITAEQFSKARMIADPINLLDSSGIADGAAAVVLCPSSMARAGNGRAVNIRASSVATDAVAVHDRHDPLWLSAAEVSANKAYQQARVGPREIDLFELHDAFTIMSALSLEAAGFAERGKGVWLAEAGEIALAGKIPMATMGGLEGARAPGGCNRCLPGGGGGPAVARPGRGEPGTQRPAGHGPEHRGQRRHRHHPHPGSF